MTRDDNGKTMADELEARRPLHNAPRRVQLTRRKGSKMPPNTVKVDRSGLYGNPYRINEPVDLVAAARWGFKLKHTNRVCTSADEAVTAFAALLAFDDYARTLIVKKLRGKNLACWCPPGQPCHADVLLEIANA